VDYGYADEKGEKQQGRLGDEKRQAVVLGFHFVYSV